MDTRKQTQKNRRSEIAGLGIATLMGVAIPMAFPMAAAGMWLLGTLNAGSLLVLGLFSCSFVQWGHRAISRGDGYAAVLASVKRHPMFWLAGIMLYLSGGTLLALINRQLMAMTLTN